MSTLSAPARRVRAAPSFAHLARMTDDTGLFEHARYATARRGHGYCTDDVARGLVVVSREPAPEPHVVRLAEIYLAFLSHAQDEDGAFHNRLGYDRRWTDQPGTGDWRGRALWGLGTAAVRSPASWIREEALAGFRRGAGVVQHSSKLRTRLAHQCCKVCYPAAFPRQSATQNMSRAQRADVPT